MPETAAKGEHMVFHMERFFVLSACFGAKWRCCDEMWEKVGANLR
jgi:hypothetical protein